MGDLVLIQGGKVDSEDIELSQVHCGQCESGMFNWRVADDGKLHLLGCCVCGTLFPVIEHQDSDVLALLEDDDEDE